MNRRATGKKRSTEQKVLIPQEDIREFVKPAISERVTKTDEMSFTSLSARCILEYSRLLLLALRRPFHSSFAAFSRDAKNIGKARLNFSMLMF